MRILLLANDDLTSSIIFAPLLQDSGLTVCGIVFPQSPARNARGPLSGAFMLLRKIAFGYWLYLVFVNGFFKLFERINRMFGGDPRNGTLVSLTGLARRHKVPVRIEKDFGSSDFLDFARKAEPDLIVTRAGAILSAEILETPKLATWCVHSSLLPAFGGIAGEFHALRHAGAEIGTTVFVVTPELDKGPPLKQVRCPRSDRSSLHNHILRNNTLAADLLLRSVRELARDGSAQTELCNEGLTPSYFSWPKGSDLTDFRKGGHRLITFSEGLAYVLSCFRLAPLGTGKT